MDNKSEFISFTDSGKTLSVLLYGRFMTMEICKEFKNAIVTMTSPADRLAVAVSGGMDSMCLLWLCLHAPFVKKENITVITIDHQLRPSSQDDMAFVVDFCARHQVNCRTFTVSCQDEGQGIELCARNKRREIFDAVRNEGMADKVLTAHHALDNVETVLMHLFRGAGLSGLSGMRMLQGNLLRPLLRVNKQQISDYVAAHQIPFVTDETNQETYFARNFIRHEILPLVRQKYAGADEAILRAAEQAAQTQAFLESVVQADAIVCKNGAVSVRLKALDNPFLARLTLIEAIKKLQGAFLDVQANHISAIMDLVNQENGAGLDLPKGLRAVREYDCITMYHRTEKPLPEEVVFASGRLQCGTHTIETVQSCAAELKQSTQGGGARALYFDPKKVPCAAVLRARRDGDIFCPYGGRTKKLKDYLIDKKIPLRLRDELICLAVGSEVLAVLGLEISDKIKVTEGASVWKISLL